MFPGFPPDALTFLRGLTRHNNREWFLPRKETFESKLKGPMLTLCEELNQEFAKFAPEYVNEPKKAVYRIYRDTRFSSDKSPYKTHLAAVFPRRGMNKQSSPGFYCSVSLEGVAVAGGIYDPTPDQMLAIREWLAANHEDFRKAARKPEKLMNGKLHGESLQRIPKGFVATHPAADLIKMKRWLYYTTLDPELTTAPELFPALVKRFKSMLPVLEMLSEPLNVRAKVRLFGAGGAVPLDRSRPPGRLGRDEGVPRGRGRPPHE